MLTDERIAELLRASNFEFQQAEAACAVKTAADPSALAALIGCREETLAQTLQAIAPGRADSFGRVFRQNSVVFATNGRPEIIVTDPTADDVGKSVPGSWRVRS